MSNKINVNRFQDFFEEDEYVVLKNHLYNYLLRKRAIERVFRSEQPDLILEVGSGLSPIVTYTDRIVFSDLSPLALQILKRIHGKGWYVAADAACLPFKDGVFSHVVCSEVLEHLPDDRKALEELSRVMLTSGRLIVTFPHRKFYFTNDDRFVGHFRRYELSDMEERLQAVGLRPLFVQKVLGPLEKITMSSLIFCYSLLQWLKPGCEKGNQAPRWLGWLARVFRWANRLYAALVWLEARIMPRALSTVLLIEAQKD